MTDYSKDLFDEYGRPIVVVTRIGRSATFIITASDATAQEKAQADLQVSDVSNAAVQTAITAGGKIVLRGSFTKSAANALSIPSNTTIELNGSITNAASLNTDGAVFTNSDLVNGNTDIQVIGGNNGLLDGNEANQTTGLQCGLIFKNVKGLKVDLKIKSFRTLDMQIAGNCTKVERNNRLRRQGNNLDIQTVEDFTVLANWVKGTGAFTTALDTTYHAVSASSIEMNTATSGTNRHITYTPAVAVDLSHRYLRLWLRIPAANYAVLAASSCLRFRVYNGATEYAEGYFTPLVFADKSDDFVYIDMPRSGFTYASGFTDSDWSNITSFQICHYNASPLDIWYGGLQSIIMPQTGAISVSFDDSNDNQFTSGLATLNTYRGAATVGIVGSYVGTANHLTWEQIKEMQSFGWDVASHTESHIDLSSLTLPEAYAELAFSFDSMKAHNLKRVTPFIILPNRGRTYSDDFYNMVRSYAWINRLTNGDDKFSSTNAIPVARYGRYITSAANLKTATLTAAETDAVKSFKFGDWKDFTVHNIKTSAGDITPAEWATFLAHLYDYGIIVKSWSQILKDSGIPPAISANNMIKQGEIRTLSGRIATLTENASNSIDNPFGKAVRVLSLDVYVFTAATATSPDIDCGIGDSATTNYTTLFNDLPGETVGFYRSIIASPGTQTVPQLWQSGSGNRYLNMSVKGAAATGMVATYTVTVMGN